MKQCLRGYSEDSIKFKFKEFCTWLADKVCREYSHRRKKKKLAFYSISKFFHCYRFPKGSWLKVFYKTKNKIQEYIGKVCACRFCFCKCSVIVSELVISV